MKAAIESGSINATIVFVTMVASAPTVRHGRMLPPPANVLTPSETKGIPTRTWLSPHPGGNILCDRNRPDSTLLHFHTKEDEYAIVLEGIAQIAYGNKVIRAEAGTSICLKRGTARLGKTRLRNRFVF